MKQKTNSIVLILVLLGFVLVSFVANRIYDWKNDISPYQAQVPTQFYAGMDKFLSNVSWMTLIQWQADDLQMKSAGAPDKLYQRLNALTNLDPLFADAYLDGALTLAATNPDQAVTLLQKAIDMGAATHNWKIPFYAGQIRLMNSNDPDKALPYFEMARKSPDVPDYVESTVLHAQCLQVKDEPVKSMKIWYAYYQHLQGPESTVRRINAAMQISEYATAAKADLDKQIETADAGKRAELTATRKEVEDIEKETGKTAAPEPTTQPAI